jgi:hypothetical protein
MPLDNLSNNQSAPNLGETRPTHIARILKNAETLADKGQGENAYRDSLNATNLAPHDPQAWYLRAKTAPSLEEQLICLSRVCSIDPSFQAAREELHQALRALLKRESSLAYLKETDDLYQVKSGFDLLINVPKNRVFEEPYLRRKPGPVEPAIRWLHLALFALPLGGIGAFFIAPIVILKSLLYQLRSFSHRDRVRALVLLLISILIWLISIPLSLIFLIHFSS